MNISLPPALRDWVQQQVNTRGFGTASEFVRDMIRRERELSIREQIDRKLLAAMDTPATELNEDDWTDIHREAQERVDKRKTA